MPPTPLTHRPQTLKQAKKAYRKAGATVRLSESEKAILERRAVLQERADRIKEREARRKANLKRKEERVQREREARHRMGMPTPPTKEGIHVGPSQLHLSEFMYAGVKRKRGNGDDEEEEEAGIHMQGKPVVHEQQERPMEPPRSWQPVQTFPASASPKWMMPSQIPNVMSPKVRDFALQENQPSPKTMPPARGPLQAKSANAMIHQNPLAGTKTIVRFPTKAADLQKPQALQIDHPPLRPPIQATITKPTNFKKPSLIPPPPKPHAIPDDSFDDFFVSNTQIQRELSPPLTPPGKPTPTTLSIPQPPTPTPQQPPPPAIKHPPADEATADLLAFISTQDLDFTDGPTQTAPPTPQDEPDPDSDFPDAELEEIVLEFELESPTKSSYARTPNDHHSKALLSTLTPINSDKGRSSHYGSDDAETQGSLQSVFEVHSKEKQKQFEEARGAAQWDVFDLSTQDLIELES
ncbi:hypothetical protein IMSHALPRED_001181 [Imshaugia aleurites]|uniref:Uncharacterized protein n=1 Tax=Imshaugia aleurites TaxID=172621 RepID=A0A8H3PF63_9LECA|nr:hypothetical protein IMSHALPRED_001181 [Imshaugia aleurites]